MVVFNPDVPKVQERDYLGWSKSIEQPQFASGLAHTLEGAGKILHNAITGTDQVVKTIAEGETRERSQAEQDIEIDRLGAAKGAANLLQFAQNHPVDPAVTDATQQAQTLVPPEQAGPPMPDKLKNLPQNLQTYSGANKKGTITETDYYGRLVQLAKDLRSKYPGYTDYIDREISRVTGVHPANALIQSTLKDINAAMLAGDDRRKQVLQEFGHATQLGVRHDGLFAAEAADKVWKGEWSPAQGSLWLNQAMYGHYKSQRDKERVSAFKDNQEVFGKMVREDYTNQAASALSTSIKRLDDKLRNTPGVTYDKDGNLVDMSSAAATQYHTNIAVDAQQFRSYLTNLTLQPYGDTGKTYAGVDPTGAKEWVDSQMAWHNQAQKWLSDGQDGLIHSSARIVKAITEDDRKELYKNKDGLAYMARVTAQWSHYPQFVQDLIQQSYGASIPQEAKDYWSVQRLEMMYKDVLNPKTPKEVIEQAKRDGMDNFPSSYDGVINLFRPSVRGSLAHPDTPEDAKLKLAAGLVNEKNYGMLSRLPGNQYDSQGRIVSNSQKSVLDLISSPENQKTIWDLSKKEKWLWPAYQNFLQKESIRMVKDQLGDLSRIPDSSQLTIGWDDTAHMWHLKTLDKSGKIVDEMAEAHRSYPPGTEQYPTYTDAARRAVNMTNSILGNFKNNPASSPEFDMDTYLFNTLQQLYPGFQADPSKITGLPARMVKSFMDSKEMAEKKKKETTNP